MEEQEKVLVLEINGRKKVLDYQKTLYEAAVLGISHVMFIITLDRIEKYDENINSMCDILSKTCEVLGIEPTNSTATVYGSFIGNSVGTMNENGEIQTFCDLPKFSNYRRRKASRERLITAEKFEKIYSKKLQV